MKKSTIIFFLGFFPLFTCGCYFIEAPCFHKIDGSDKTAFIKKFKKDLAKARREGIPTEKLATAD